MGGDVFLFFKKSPQILCVAAVCQMPSLLMTSKRSELPNFISTHVNRKTLTSVMLLGQALLNHISEFRG